ncbi:hypothetical protein EUB11_12700, partial [Mycobacterium tuberculosis]
TTLNARDQPPAEVSDQRVSGLTGAVHVGLPAVADKSRLTAAAWRILATFLGPTCLARARWRTAFPSTKGALHHSHRPSGTGVNVLRKRYWMR